MQMSIARSFKVFGFLVVTGFCISLTASTIALNNLKIGSSSYEEIVASKDFVSDILPPPEYMLEAYLEVQLALTEMDRVQDHFAQLVKLKADYIERRDFWAKSRELPGDIRTELTVASDEQVQKFWHEIETSFMPAVLADDRNAETESLKRLTQYYNAHRAITLDLVLKANAFAAAAEIKAAHTATILESIMFGTAGLTILSIIWGIRKLRQKASDPLNVMAAYMERLVGQTYDDEVPFILVRDEIGNMARATNIFRKSLIANDRNRVEQETLRRSESYERAEREVQLQAERDLTLSSIGAGLSALSTKDLSYRLTGKMPAAYAKLQSDFNATVNQLSQTMTEVIGRIEAIGASTNEIATAARDLSVQTEQQAVTLEETSATLSVITHKVDMAAEGAIQASLVVKTAKSETTTSCLKAREVVEAMRRIETSSNSIGQILGVMDEIAFQTNLLALNAGVEAARAGDAGRGFAVVATEVRALAVRSAEAAREIKGLIQTSSVEVAHGVRLVDETVTGLDKVVLQVEEIDQTFAHIAKNAEEQAFGLKEVNLAVRGLDKSTQRTAAMGEETTAATNQLKDEAEELARTINGFNVNSQKVMSGHQARPSRALARVG